MTLAEQINEDIKTAMKARDEASLRALRALKSALLLAATAEGAGDKVEDEQAIKIFQKLAKQRKESMDIFLQNGREELAQKEPEAGDDAAQLANIEPAAGEAQGALGNSGFGFGSSFDPQGVIPISAVGPLDPTALQYNLPEFEDRHRVVVDRLEVSAVVDRLLLVGWLVLWEANGRCVYAAD